MLDQETIWRIFEDSGALLHGHFRLTSGLHSDRYIQCARVLMWPRHAEALSHELLERLGRPALDVVIGPATGGIILAYELARQAGARALFTEREADGKMALRRGFAIREGERVLAVEDVVTTGGSVAEVVELAQRAGGRVTAVAALVDRSGGRVELGLPLVSLLQPVVQTYQPEDCPLCRQGLPAEKPGSRKA